MGTHVPSHADLETVFGLDPRGRGLTDDHLFEVARLARRLPGRWIVERCEDEVGAAFALLVQDVDGEDGLTFALFRHGGEFHLDLFLGECLDPLATFGTVQQAMDRVGSHVSRTPLWTGGGAPDGGTR